MLAPPINVFDPPVGAYQMRPKFVNMTNEEKDKVIQNIKNKSITKNRLLTPILGMSYCYAVHATDTVLSIMSWHSTTNCELTQYHRLQVDNDVGTF